MKHKNIFTLIAIVTILMISTVISCDRQPVVKGDGSANDSDELNIDTHDSDAIVEKMPVHKETIDPEIEKAVQEDNDLNLVTVIASIGRVVKEAQDRGFSIDDIKSSEKWNTFIKNVPRTGEAFRIDNEFEIEKVIMLEDLYISADDIFENFSDQLSELTNDKWVFFIYMDPAKPGTIDYVGSYVAMRVDNPDERSVSELRGIARMIHQEDDLFVIRFATRTPEMDKKRPNRPE